MNDLYKVITRSTTAENHFFTIEINPEAEILKGHFPSMPVMPGVCSLSIIKNLVSELMERKLSYYNIKESKFLSAILPDKCNIIDVKITVLKEDTDSYKVSSEIIYEDKIVMKLKASMR